jgi:hypothetical protein
MTATIETQWRVPLSDLRVDDEIVAAVAKALGRD